MSSPARNPWSPGTPSPSPHGAAFVSYTPDSLKSSYHLMISGIQPRPVAFVSTIDPETGVGNLAPFSYFGAMSHDPPTLCVGICNKAEAEKKDTLRNIEATGEFVVNMVSSWFLDAANHCSGNFDRSVDEMLLSGLHPLPSDVVRPPRCAESAFQMECKVIGRQEIFNAAGQHTTTIITGEVVKFHVSRELVEEQREGVPRIRSGAAYEPMGRLGGDTWLHTASAATEDLPRPAV